MNAPPDFEFEDSSRADALKKIRRADLVFFGLNQVQEVVEAAAREAAAAASSWDGQERSRVAWLEQQVPSQLRPRRLGRALPGGGGASRP